MKLNLDKLFYLIAMYDLEDNYLYEFKNYKECAKYFNTSKDSIQCYICRNRQGKVDRKRDKSNKRWVRLFKIGD